MPQFLPGESKTARAPITVKPSGLSCQAEVFLGPNEMTKVATSGRIPFVSTGASQNVRLPVTMPAAEGTYPVYIDVYAEGLLVGAYQALEDVLIKGVAKFEYVSAIRLTYLGPTNHNAAYRLEVDIQNIGDVSGICHSEIMSQVGLRDDPVGWWLPPDSAWMLDNTPPYRDLTLAPGQIGTVSGIVMWHWQLWQQWIISGDAGTILSAVY